MRLHIASAQRARQKSSLWRWRLPARRDGRVTFHGCVQAWWTHTL